MSNVRAIRTLLAVLMGAVLVAAPRTAGANPETDRLIPGPDAYASADGGQPSVAPDGQAGFTVVPEPASLVLLGTGLLGAARRWRKRRS